MGIIAFSRIYYYLPHKALKMPTKSLAWINDLFPGHAPLTEHQLGLLSRGELRACEDIDKLPSNASPRENYILKSHPLSMACFRSKDAAKDIWFFKNLEKKAAAGNRKAIAELARRTARLNVSKTTLLEWISGLPEVIASGENAEDIYNKNFPKHTSVDDLAEMMTSNEGINVCLSIIFNPFAGMPLGLPPAVEEAAEVYPSRCLISSDSDDYLFEPPEMTVENLTERVSSLRSRVDDHIAALDADAPNLPPAVEEERSVLAVQNLPAMGVLSHLILTNSSSWADDDDDDRQIPALTPAVEKSPFSDWNGPPAYSDAELKQMPDALTLKACAHAKRICTLATKGEDFDEIVCTPSGFESEMWIRLVSTYFIKHTDKMVAC